jgi:hypothetical protein
VDVAEGRTTKPAKSAGCAEPTRREAAVAEIAIRGCRRVSSRNLHLTPHQPNPSRSSSLRAAEIEALSVPASTGKGNPQDDLSEFYTRFNKINKVYADRQAGQEPELRSFLRGLEELVASDGLEHVVLEDGEEEVIDRMFRRCPLEIRFC